MSAIQFLKYLSKEQKNIARGMTSVKCGYGNIFKQALRKCDNYDQFETEEKKSGIGKRC